MTKDAPANTGRSAAAAPVPLFLAASLALLLSSSSWIDAAEAFSLSPPSSTMTTTTTTIATTTTSTSTTPDALFSRRRRQQHRQTAAAGRLFASGEAAASLSLPLEEDDEDEEMEWVEEEFELLTERDFYNTEWKIGTIMDNKPREASSIDTTWVRLITADDGTNKAVWGDDSKGKWTVDVPSQFFSISKESFGGWFGKQIWAGTIEDFYYLEGTVRGWSPISPASVEGQWQAVRLGKMDGERVGAEERGEAPWFMAAEEEMEEVQEVQEMEDDDSDTDADNNGEEVAADGNSDGETEK